VTVQGPLTEPVSVRYRTLSGTADAISDYTHFRPRVDDILTFNPGDPLTKDVVIDTYPLSGEENSEFLTLELYDPTNGEFPAGAAALRATGWIIDEDNAGLQRALQVSSPVVVEGNQGQRFAEFTISVSQPYTTDVMLSYTTIDGSAVASSDYVAQTNQQVLLPQGETEVTVSVPVIGDAIVESGQFFHLKVTPPAGLATGAIGSVGTAVVIDDDASNVPTVSIEAADATEVHGNGFPDHMPVVVRLSRESLETVTVKFQVREGTATEGSDYSDRDTFGEVTFLPGETSKVVRVNSQPDTEEELDESAIVEIFDPENAVLEGGARVLRRVGWIHDEDNPGNRRTIFVTAPDMVERGPGGDSVVLFDIVLSRPADEAFQVSYQTLGTGSGPGHAIADQDYVPTAGVLQFAAGQTRASVAVQLKHDFALEAGETFRLRITPPFPPAISSETTGAIATVTIGDSSIAGTQLGEQLTGTALADAVYGLAGNDALFGLAGNDLLVGGLGNDAMTGGPGNDTMQGGPGNDSYNIDTPGDRIIEFTGQSTDTVVASFGYVLPVDLENLTLIGGAAINGTGNGLGNVLRGNAAANILNGLGGNDALDGGGGNDRMIGGLGNDSYVVGSVGDVVVELPGGGTDTVRAAISLLLPANVENLTLTGFAAINGTGNALNNVIRGNTAANALAGGLGNDLLVGDRGADAMAGGAGNDAYVVDHPGDRVTEAAGAGTDLVQSSVTHFLAANVENLTLVGSAAINGTGNAGANVLRGNAAANALQGGPGADQMLGGRGNDTYVVDHAGDRVIEAAGQGLDRVLSSVSHALGLNVENAALTGGAAANLFGNALANGLAGNAAGNLLAGGAGSDVLHGNAGNDRLVGGLGRDVQAGGANADTFAFNSAAETAPGALRDIIQDFTRGADRIDLSAIDASVLNPGNQAFAFIGAAAFTGRAGQARFAGGLVQGDINGDGLADFHIAVQNVAALAGTDFIL
jgi:Ca2+-binding RTX toxin-like protein